MGRPRVLLLDDDPAMRRFVQLALEDLPLQVLPCATLLQARQVLTRTEVQLVLTDLSLSDGSGLDLLDWLQARQFAVAPRVLVLSGGVDAALQSRLRERGVWQILHKPASVGSLIACVSDALDGLAAKAPAAVMPQSDPVAEFFVGNRQFYDTYRVACMAQFPKDLLDGDRAAGDGDAQSLRRVAHNLKSILILLGHTQVSYEARSAEQAAAQGEWPSALEHWQRLRAQVQALLATERGPPVD
ncbi:MAG: response regulator [Acidovorax sp.]|nr:response regulator [Acidovorax sp.]